jgi:hypothetical protein
MLPRRGNGDFATDHRAKFSSKENSPIIEIQAFFIL